MIDLADCVATNSGRLESRHRSLSIFPRNLQLEHHLPFALCIRGQKVNDAFDNTSMEDIPIYCIIDLPRQDSINFDANSSDWIKRQNGDSSEWLR